MESPEVRRKTMQAVKGQDTQPELTVRKLVHRLGYRFRLHCKSLPGKPDLIFPRLHKALFVHGCFWHGHNCRRGARIPKANRDYWLAKISNNRVRDRKNLRALTSAGWKSLVIWECELKDSPVADKLLSFLST
jgi:DNA mismatch endonuclease (patch repair protein)